MSFKVRVTERKDRTGDGSDVVPLQSQDVPTANPEPSDEVTPLQSGDAGPFHAEAGEAAELSPLSDA